MFGAQTEAGSVLRAMLVTGIILAPAVMATQAVQDLTDLRTVINAAADTIGDQNNPNRGWGIGLFGGNGQMGTADLLNNVTSTILRSKFQIDTNKTMWLSPSNLTNATDPSLNVSLPSPLTPTLPLTSSLALPSTLPTSTPSLENITTDLSTPYIDYVSSIPSLSTSLISLGRAWHREMNSPVSDAINMLQESMNTLQTTMLQNDLIDSSAVLRTLRASTSLESAQQAWSRFLNLPASTGNDDLTGSNAARRLSSEKRSVLRLAPTNGGQYTHKELWGRKEGFKTGVPSRSDAAVDWKEEVGKLKQGVALPFNA
ncbi:hypothetical protein N0V94_003314 [Neodidymelliopsis sp. IMI 364377]|nr:hypothetical protein N0V94_003314 [Neodidymelliopsis sp. IMI 364377]